MWGIVLSHGHVISLSRQIYLSFKDRIVKGQLPPGEALPSTRELARGLGVSRNTVNEAYDMLWTEGYIVRRQGAPSCIAQGLALKQHLNPAPVKSDRVVDPVYWDFKTGQPDLSCFPWQLWRRLLHEQSEHMPKELLAYSDVRGYRPLCREISAWLLRSRSMQVDPEDIFITSGATQALYLLAQLLHKQGHAFALEDPSHQAMRTVLTDKGYPVHWMPVDRQGADFSTLQDAAISAVYVTPSHQFPLGAILPAQRRANLIRLAAARDFYIIEDDYDSEFRYCGPPVSPIYSMDASRVIYVGTFSKSLFPALRLGFAILPKELHGRWKHDRNYMDVQNPVLEQLVLSSFLSGRKIDRHIRYMTKLYGEKRKLLLEAVKEHFGSTVQPWGDASGLHVAVEFPGRKFDSFFIKSCSAAGIRIALVTQYCGKAQNHADKLLLGYGHLSPEQIQQGIKALRQLII